MTILSLSELNELRIALVSAFVNLHDLQAKHPIARLIKAPQVPSAFSESLTIHLLQKGLILPELQTATFTLGKEADIVARHNDKVFRIEVKATGDKGFQRLGQKDLLADYLIWIHFDLFFRGNHDKPIFVWVVEKPGRFFTKDGITPLAIFKKKVGTNLQEIQVIFDSLM